MILRSVLLFALLSSSTASADDWRDAGLRAGVRVSTRKVEGSSVQEMRLQGVIEAPADRVMTVIGDIESYPQRMPPTVEARLLRREGDTAWYYMVINPPMVLRRDYCIRVTLSRLPGGQLRSDWVVDETYCPAQRPGLVRITRNTGSWVLTPSADGQHTDVVYQSFTDPGGAIPGWMVNRASVGQLPEIFNTVRRTATQLLAKGEAR